MSIIVQDDEAGQGDNPLAGWIRDRLLNGGPVTFATFMRWALYHPEFGYYSVGPDIGPRGDFTTSPEASSAFGRLLAIHTSEIDALLGRPSVFHLVECGPGRGTLALDLLDELAGSYPQLYDRLRYWLVEVSSGLMKAQKQLLLPAHAGVTEWAESLEQLPGGFDGALIANEVADAFPVHVLENRGGTIFEHFVAVGESNHLCVITMPPSDQRLLDFIEKYQIELGPGQKIEINLAAEDWIAQIGRTLGRGVATVIDYGDTSPARYSEARKEGSLLGYRGGSVTDNLVANPGKQDLTALVDFTAIEDAALANGLTVVGLTRQANFLLGLGLGTTVTAVASRDEELSIALANRRGLHALVNPEGLGKFHVLLLAKGVGVENARVRLSGMKYANVG